ncbi:MAG: ABC transporter ATP-binding protein [Armatimonadota bacterium]
MRTLESPPPVQRDSLRLQDNLVTGRLPESLQGMACALDLADATILFAIRSDLHLDGTEGVAWVIVTDTHVSVAQVDDDGCRRVTGPIALNDMEKVRRFSSVGSAFLQMRINGLYVDVIRYSNARRELFGRVLRQLERLLAGQPFQPDALMQPSELVCDTCGLPLPNWKSDCQRCQRNHGIFLRALELMRGYYGLIVMLLILMLAGVGLDLLPPLLTRMLVDDVLVPHKNTHWLPYILLGLMLAAAVRSGLSILTGRLTAMISTRITRELREKMVCKLLTLSVDYYNRHSVGGLMSRVLSDVEYFQSFVTQVSQGLLVNVMMVIGIGVVLFTMNWFLALLVIVPIPLAVFGTVYFWKHIYPLYYRVSDSQAKMSQLLSSLLSGVRLVKAFGQEEREQGRFIKSADYMRENRIHLDAAGATFGPIMGFLFGTGGLLIWYAGGHLVLEDVITLGTLMAFFAYLGMFYGPVQSLMTFSNWVTGFIAAGQRIYDVLDANITVDEPEEPVAMSRLDGAIEFRNVVFGYDPFLPVLKGVSFRIEQGQFVGIVGKSGSGKTTLVNLICRFYDPQQGEVIIDGVNVRDIPQDDLHRDIGLVLQEPFLFRASIEDNIAYGRPDSTMLEIMDATKAANAHDFIVHRPLAYDTMLGEHGSGLSGGERQRVSIARALLCDPRILILDEATSSVDTESELEIQKALAQVCKGRTTIAIAHRLSTLKNADWIFVMDDGRIAESGTHEQLMERQGIYYRLVRIQTELTRLEV